MRVVLIAAQSLDGWIAMHAVPGTAFTSPEDKAWFPACLENFDCCVFGGATYREARATIQTQLEYSGRRRIVVTRNPELYSGEARPGKLEFTAEKPAAVVARLTREGHRQCALLGGGDINGLFLQAGLVDEAWITIEPRIFGEGRPLASGRMDIRLHLAETVALGPDVRLFKYTVERPTLP
jgi:dihydrofolate reductase